MAKSKKKLWCVSFKHDEMESELIYHVNALTRDKAERIAMSEFINNNENYLDDEELFDYELEQGILSILVFEVKQSEILS